MHWSDTSTPASYNIYRCNNPIDSANINSVQLVATNVQVGSAKDRIATKVAVQSGKVDPNIGLRIYDLTEPLDPQDELWVHTVKETGTFYYAIIPVDSNGGEDRTIIPGGNSLINGIAESIADSIPVIEESDTYNNSGYLYPYKRYILYRRDDEAQQDGSPTKFCITQAQNYNPSKQYQMIVSLWGYGGSSTISPWWNTIVISPSDINPDLTTSDTYSWWYGWADGYPNADSGIVHNYTEKTLLHIIDFATANNSVDKNRILLIGHSMGATGSISFGMRHPEIFAGISVTCPQVNPGLPGTGFRTQLRSIWGTVSTNLPTDEGIGVWDRMNMTDYIAQHKEDLPFLKVLNNKNDYTLPWVQIPDFYRNLNASHHGFIAAWGENGHSSSTIGVPAEFVSFNILDKIKLNQSYPAISNSSVNNDPGNGDPTDGDSTGQMNAGYDWNILTDTQQEWSASIEYTPGTNVYADVSARRLQNFSFAANDSLSYVVVNSDTNAIVKRGFAATPYDRLFIVPQIPFDGGWTNLYVYHTPEQTPVNIKDLPENASVNVDKLVVTAVFSDVCYAEGINRLPAVALLNATGLSVGDFIYIQGSKTIYGNLCAISAASSGIHRYGQMDIKPLGMNLSTSGSQAKDIALGLLVKTWGCVKNISSDSMTINCGAGSIFVSGNTGTNPLKVGDWVSVVGINADIFMDTGTIRGIRIRTPGDITPI